MVDLERERMAARAQMIGKEQRGGKSGGSKVDAGGMWRTGGESGEATWRD